MKAVTKETYRIFWRHARQYRWRLALIVLCLAGATATEALTARISPISRRILYGEA